MEFALLTAAVGFIAGVFLGVIIKAVADGDMID